MAAFSKGDSVKSVGRIKVIQTNPDRNRFIEFERGNVLDIEGNLVVIQPFGMSAIVKAQPDDLDEADETSSHEASSEAQDAAEGTVPLSGGTAPVKPAERTRAAKSPFTPKTTGKSIAAAKRKKQG